jgi:hypothetical protein
MSHSFKSLGWPVEELEGRRGEGRKGYEGVEEG